MSSYVVKPCCGFLLPKAKLQLQRQQLHGFIVFHILVEDLAEAGALTCAASPWCAVSVSTNFIQVNRTDQNISHTQHGQREGQ